LAPAGRAVFPPHLAWVRLPERDPDLGLAADGEDITGIYAWRVGNGLGSELAALAAVDGRTVLDLGCGRGALGLSALALGARHVTFADASPVVVDWLARLVALNRLEARARVVRHAWGEPAPGAPVALVLGGDVLYRPALHGALLASIAGALAADGQALLSDPRERLEAELPALAAAQGLAWEHERRGDSTLVRLRRTR
jgi:predicted nicotinamide N-methyase